MTAPPTPAVPAPTPALTNRAELDGRAVPVRLVEAGAQDLGPAAAANDFSGQAGRLLILGEGADGPQVLFGLGEAREEPSAARAQALRGLAARLPAGDYALETHPGLDPADAALAWAQGARVFDRYKADRGRPSARLAVAGEVLAAVLPQAEAAALARDLVDTPANDLGPAEIEVAARALAARHGAEVSVVVGDDLLAQGYPAVHAVGRAAASHRAPRMIELTWEGPGAQAGAPRLVIVGKGVAFDTGGLDLKPSAGMRWMKKDMGGAAHALALAHLVMSAAPPVRLTVLIPAVENVVAADAMRPGDVLATRAGRTVEVGNTDAEGRLILADALARAGELEPDLTIDLATLTGAARAALGPEVPPFYTPDEALAGELAAAAASTADPLWRMPLWAPYDQALASDVADLKNDADPWAQAGSITAALFLQRFAPATGSWLHLDIFAWNPRGRPGWPQGGEAQGLRALHRVLQRRYGGRA